MTEKVFTVQVIVSVDMDAYARDYGMDNDATLDSMVVADLEEWAQGMLDGGENRSRKWEGIGRTIAGSVNGECRWFAHCDQQATAVREHPILGAVPVCPKHHKRLAS